MRERERKRDADSETKTFQQVWEMESRSVCVKRQIDCVSLLEVWENAAQTVFV